MPTDALSLLTRFARLEKAPRRLVTEAAIYLATVKLVLAIHPFRRAIRFGSIPLSRRDGSIADCVWAVEAVGRGLPWRSVCIDQGLALQRMVRRRGQDARLHYGVGKGDGEADLTAHVWVTLDGEVLIGAAEAGRFAPVAVFP